MDPTVGSGGFVTTLFWRIVKRGNEHATILYVFVLTYEYFESLIKC